MINETELPPPTPDDEAFSPETLREVLLESQRRDRVSVRVGFCQEFKDDRAPEPLHLFARERRLFALQLYLLLLCVAQGDPWDARMSGTSWALALDRENAGAASTVSRNLAWLVEQKLVDTLTADLSPDRGVVEFTDGTLGRVGTVRLSVGDFVT